MVHVMRNSGKKFRKAIVATSTAAFTRSVATLLIAVAVLWSIGSLSACSTANTASPAPAQSGASTLPAAQAGATSTSNQPAQTSTTTPSPVAAPPTQEHLVGVGSATVVTIHGKVVSVNRAKKLVTLEGPGGKQVTLHVYNPYNLAAAKAGTPFVAKFYEIVTIRKKRKGETLPIASVSEGIVSAMPGQTPGAVAGTRTEMIVTIDAIDPDNETVAVKGPDGRVETISVANPANLKYVKVGEQIVVTLSNVVAIALEKDNGE